MSTFSKLLAFFGIKIRKMKITLIGHEREGGYIYITSPDHPGFTFMLSPGEIESFRSFIDAIEEPLMAFCAAQFEAQESEGGIQLTGLRHSRANNYVAEFGYA